MPHKPSPPSAPSDPSAEKPMRLAKRMADAGVCSRRKAEEKILQGLVKVNGKLVETPAFTVVSTDSVVVEGKLLESQRPATRMWIFHKPTGCLTTHSDPQGRATIFDILPRDLPRVITIGRLDYNSEGLLLLTNNGEVARYCSLPQTGWKRKYRVRAFGAIPHKFKEKVASGVTIDGIRYGAIGIEIDSTKEESPNHIPNPRARQNFWFTVTLTEGKNREIRNVFEHFGLAVNRLIRTAYGPFNLDELPRGKVQEVPPKFIRNYLP
ncbi:MAG: rRNA pseudouridine synthase [Alphaproteobacteria bacterium]|nr:rRNA pseudouridine synthase [Alphaproteobacteria bacterium]